MRVADLSPEARERKRARDKERDRGRRVTGKVNSTYKLTEEDRRQVSTLLAMRLWSKAGIAKAWGIHPRTVGDCARNYLPLGVKP